jgi:hypothetical protein
MAFFSALRRQKLPASPQGHSMVFTAGEEGLTQRVIASIHANGVALVKGGLPAKELEAFKTLLIDWRDRKTAEVAAGMMPEETLHYHLTNGIDGPAFRAEIDDLLALVMHSPFLDIARNYLTRSQPVVVPINHLLFRIRDADGDNLLMKRDGSTHVFHQDYLLIPEYFPLNLWIPLSKVDAQCNGLSFMFPYSETVRPLPFDAHGYLDANKGHVWTPDVEPGDMLLFHRYTIHGFFTKASTMPRYSVEFRCGSANQVPENLRNTLWFMVPRN